MQPKAIPTTDDPDSRLALVLLRYRVGFNQQELAEAADISTSKMSDYDQGKKNVSQEHLNRAADATHYPRVLLAPVRKALRSFRLAARGWSRAERVTRDSLFADLLALLGGAIDTVVPPASTKEARRELSPEVDREEAERLWRQLARRSPQQREALVEEGEEFRTWALVERVAAESVTVAASDPAEALNLAKLARRMAQLCPVGKPDQWRLEGYARIHVANALRALNDLRGVAKELTDARKLWEAGQLGDPGLLNEARVLGLEANLYRALRRFPEAMKRIGEALAADQGGLRGRLLLTKSQILLAVGNVEQSTTVLQEAAPLVTESRDFLGVKYQLLANLCRLGRASEAEPGLGEVQVLAAQGGSRLDLLRVIWLRGAVHAGMGRLAEARTAFEEVRRAFEVEKLALSCALVSLELALVLLEQGHTREVRAIAEEMVWIFSAQGVHQEALAALRIFCEAARREAATVELTRRVIRYLDRAQHDPELRFEAEGAG